MSLRVCLFPAGSEASEAEEPLFEANYTHNVIPIAQKAGLYGVVWRPESSGIETAAELIEPLQAGLERLKEDPGEYEVLNPANGWGSYETFCEWLKTYLAACRDFPDALVSVSR